MWVYAPKMCIFRERLLGPNPGHFPVLQGFPKNSKTLCIAIPPPSVTGEVYCFPRRQLIFRFGRRVIYHSKGL